MIIYDFKYFGENHFCVGGRLRGKTHQRRNNKDSICYEEVAQKKQESAKVQFLAGFIVTL